MSVATVCPFQFSFQSCHFHTHHLLRGARCRTARVITPAQPTSQASTPSSEHLWDELGARGGESDKWQTIYPRWHPSLTRFATSPVSRDTNMELSAVLATSCATHTTTHTFPFCDFAHLSCSATQWKTRPATARDGSSEEKSHSLPQGSSLSKGREAYGHEKSVHKGLDVSLGAVSFVYHLNQFLSRDGKSPGHFLEKRTPSPERQPMLHTSATTISKTNHDADIIWTVPVHGWNLRSLPRTCVFGVLDTQYRKPYNHLPLRRHPVSSASFQIEAMWKLRLEIGQTKRVCGNGVVGRRQ